MGSKTFLFLATLSLVVSLGYSYKVVCYYTNWAQYRAQPYAFTPEDIDPSLCTHINYAFAKVVGTNLHPYEDNDDTNGGMFSRIMKVKQTNPSIKVLLSVGGWTHGSAPFSAVVQSESSMHAFATHSLNYLRQRHFDGLDIDWEYPGNRGSPAGDKQKFTKFLQIIKDTFTAESTKTGNPRLLLTAAVGAGKYTIDSAYEISKISAILDYVNLMSYDLHGYWDSTAGENSPLYPLHTEHNDQRTLNQDWAVNYWLQNGCPRNKLIMGLGAYGRSLHLSRASQHEPYDKIVGPGKMGSILQEEGFVAYYEVCLALKSGYTKEWNAEQDVPYAYKDTDWIGYDDPRSFEIKANYIKSKHLGGAMVWAIDLDDFVNTCGQGKWPLMSTLKRILLDNTNSHVTSSTSQHHTTGHTTHHVVTHINHHTTGHTTHHTTGHPTRQVVTHDHHHTHHHVNTHAPTIPTTGTNTHVVTHKWVTVQTTATTATTGQKCRPPVPSHCDHAIYPDLCDCQYYYVCDDRGGGGNIVFREHKCPDKTVFDLQQQYCNWEDQVGRDACKISAVFGK